jgi:hypothetical protein
MEALLRILAIATSLSATTLLCVPAALAVQASAGVPTMVELLFVQDASSVEIGAGGRTLTPKGLSPTTLFFSDRSVRIAGHYRTE